LKLEGPKTYLTLNFIKYITTRKCIISNQF